MAVPYGPEVVDMVAAVDIAKAIVITVTIKDCCRLTPTQHMEKFIGNTKLQIQTMQTLTHLKSFTKKQLTNYIMKTTEISFSPEHLEVLQVALETYTRLRAGQFDIAMGTAFRDMFFTREELQTLNKSCRDVVFPSPPQLTVCEHADSMVDQYGCTYDSYGKRDTPVTYAERARRERECTDGGNYGITHPKMKECGASVAYETLCVIRQYLAVSANDGYIGNGVNFYDPIAISGVPLPAVKDFSLEKEIIITDRKLIDLLSNKSPDGTGCSSQQIWDVVNKFLKRQLPEFGGCSDAQIKCSSQGVWSVILTKPKKTQKDGF